MNYGCYNRKPFATEQRINQINKVTGDFEVLVIPHNMTKDCQYQKTDVYKDPGCVGCIHKQGTTNEQK